MIRNNNNLIDLKGAMNKTFKIKDLTDLKYIFSVEVARSRKGIQICQHKYELDLLKEISTLENITFKLPLDQDVKLSKRFWGGYP